MDALHQAIAVQATGTQVAEFRDLVKATATAKDQLSAFAAAKNSRAGFAPVDQSWETAGSANKKFQDGFSPAQKSGLKDTMKRLEKADLILEESTRHLDRSVQGESANAEFLARSAAVDKALCEFSDAQLALGREMGITLASGQDITFSLPQVRTIVKLADRTIPVSTSGEFSQPAVEGDLRSFNLALNVDLSGLQQSIEEVLNVELSRVRSCGHRLAVLRQSWSPRLPQAHSI